MDTADTDFYSYLSIYWEKATNNNNNNNNNNPCFKNSLSNLNVD